MRWCGRLLDGVSADVREGQQVRQYVDDLRTNTVAVTATGSCSIWQVTGSEGLDEAYVPFFGAFSRCLALRHGANDGPTSIGDEIG